MELIGELAPLGVGGVLAGVMFYIYRSDRVSSEKRHREDKEILVQVVSDNTGALTALREELRRGR